MCYFRLESPASMATVTMIMGHSGSSNFLLYTVLRGQMALSLDDKKAILLKAVLVFN